MTRLGRVLFFLYRSFEHLWMAKEAIADLMSLCRAQITLGHLSFWVIKKLEACAELSRIMQGNPLWGSVKSMCMKNKSYVKQNKTGHGTWAGRAHPKSLVLYQDLSFQHAALPRKALETFVFGIFPSKKFVFGIL
jgi:hypothetical protein